MVIKTNILEGAKFALITAHGNVIVSEAVYTLLEDEELTDIVIDQLDLITIEKFSKELTAEQQQEIIDLLTANQNKYKECLQID